LKTDNLKKALSKVILDFMAKKKMAKFMELSNQIFVATGASIDHRVLAKIANRKLKKYDFFVCCAIIVSCGVDANNLIKEVGHHANTSN